MNLSRAFTRETRYFRSSDHTRRDRAEDLVRLLLRDEDAHVARDPRHRGEAAADEHAEALAAVLVHGADQRDAVDLGRVAAVGAGGDRVLVLPRQVRPVGVAVEEVGGGVDDRRGVEELVGRDSLHGAAGDVAHRVAAAAGGRDARGARGARTRRAASRARASAAGCSGGSRARRRPCRRGSRPRRPRAGRPAEICPAGTLTAA